MGIILRDLLRNIDFKVGFVIFIIMLIFCIISFFTPYDPRAWHVVPRDLPPSLSHPFGTNSLGKDIFWDTLVALRNSISVASLAAFISRFFSVILGLISGYKGGTVDRVITFLTDVFLTLPLVLILLLIASLGGKNLSPVKLGLIMGCLSWAWDTRVIRSKVLSLRESDFTYTALLSGQKSLTLVTKEYLPFIFPIVFSTFINNMIWCIGMEITLGIFGLLSVESPTLGVTLYWAIKYQAVYLGLWWWLLAPLLISIFLIVSLYLISISTSEYLDPRMRTQRVG